MSQARAVVVIGAGIFGLSLAIALHSRGYEVTVFDLCDYDQSTYHPEHALNGQAASADHNKILRPSYGTKIHYQRLALESREEWLKINQEYGSKLFVDCGMLRVQPSEHLAIPEEETLASLKRDGLRHTQFVKNNTDDHWRAAELGWAAKLLDFGIPAEPDKLFEAVLDSLSGFVKCSEACAYLQSKASSQGVKFRFGNGKGRCDSLVLDTRSEGAVGDIRKVVGVKTRDGTVHTCDTVVVAAGSFSTQILPDLSYQLESSAGSIAMFKIEETETDLWNKYAPENFPVLTWKSVSRDKNGHDKGSVYALPRNEDGLVKIGY